MFRAKIQNYLFKKFSTFSAYLTRLRTSYSAYVLDISNVYTALSYIAYMLTLVS